MARIHLFEFEDLSWFPVTLRNYATDFLQFLANKTQMYKPIIPVLVDALKKCDLNEILDLASGGGGSLLWLSEEMKKDIPNLKITLSDYYPNILAFKYNKEQSHCIDYYNQPVDARNVPTHLNGMRTLFLSFHHFNEQDALQILQNAVDQNTPIAIIEAQERSFLSILGMVFSPITLLLSTPFIRPFKWGRILFTYIIPLLLPLVLWDGVVSCFRTYSIKEMKALVSKVENKKSFDWEIKRIKSGPGIILYLVATPK